MTSHKLALVTLDYPPDRGGVARYLKNLVRESHGRLDVFIPATHARDEFERVQAVKMFSFGWPKWYPMISFMRGLRQHGYAGIVISHALPVGTAAWLARLCGGLPYAIILHGLDLRLAQRSRFKAWLLRRVLLAASLVVTNSKFVADETRVFDGRIKPLVLTPGLESLSFVTRSEARQTLGLKSEERIILAVTRLVPRKGIDQVIRALSDLPPSVRLVVIGDGQDRARLECLASHLGERASFLPRVDNDSERNLWYAAADVFALPVRDEVTDVEGFGIVYLEAQAAGLPVIAGRSGGASEAVIENETGLLVNPLQTSELVQAIKRLLEDDALRQRMGEAGQRWAARFCWADRWREFEEAWDKLCINP